jgi:hypothetical protein
MEYNISSISDKDYTLVENDAGELADFYGIRLKTGKWKNVVFVYGKVSVREDKNAGSATLSFNYTIQDPVDYDIEKLEKDPDFNNYLGALLQHIISDNLENKEAQIGHKTPTTDTHTEQLTQ